MKEHGHNTARLDVTYMSSLDGKPNSNPMDILSDSGMAMLVLNIWLEQNIRSCLLTQMDPILML